MNVSEVFKYMEAGTGILALLGVAGAFGAQRQKLAQIEASQAAHMKETDERFRELEGVHTDVAVIKSELSGLRTDISELNRKVDSLVTHMLASASPHPLGGSRRQR